MPELKASSSTFRHLSLRDHAAALPQNIAVADGATSLTYAELSDAVTELSGRFAQAGIGVATPVMVLFDVCAASVVAYWALRTIGAIVVVGDPTASPDDLQQCAERTGAGHVLVGQRAQARLSHLPGKAWHVLETAPDAKAVWRLDMMNFRSPVRQPDFPQDAAVVLFSSGTTGRPKAIVHTTASLIGLHEVLKRTWLLAPGDRVLGCLPFHTIYGLLFSAGSAIHAGASLYLTDRFKPDLAMAAIKTHRITTAALVPTMILMMLNSESRDSYDLGSLRAVYSASAPITDTDVVRFTEFAKTRLITNYGMTEIPGAAVEPADEAHVPHSVGRVSPGFEVSVRAKDGSPLPVGETGEICLRGPSMMQGYLEDPAQTADRIRDGWVHTQDIGRVDAQGNIFLSGRTSELIMRGGLNISPREVEAALSQHPGVLDAFVMGQPDPIYGQTVMAVVALRSGNTDHSHEAVRAELMTLCGQHLAKAKQPARIEFLDELPRNAGGKVLRPEIERIFGLNEGSKT